MAEKTSGSIIIRDASGYSVAAIADRLIRALGGGTVAALLGVGAGSPELWASGADLPTAEHCSAVADLDGLVCHLLSAFTPEQASLWLGGTDPHLGGRPIDVYRHDGAAPIIEAIRAFQQGAFA